MTSERHHLPYTTLPQVQRGKGIVNRLIAHKQVGARAIHSGITDMPPGASVPAHSHNAEEQVTVIQGTLRIRIGDRTVDCGPCDSTFISAGVEHEFSNIGSERVLVMVIYGTADPTRTFVGTGETVEIGSEGDTFTGR